jgi:hypothetical protein
MPEEKSPWLRLTVRETDEGGVELPKLARLLENLSSTFYAIAREKVGTGAGRPGPRTLKEDALAALRLVRVEPGSAVIELAPPRAAAQGQLAITDEPTPDDVAFEFFEEARRIEAGEEAAAGRWDIRRRVRAVVEDAAQIGARAEIEFRPLFPRPNLQPGAVMRTTLRTRQLPVEVPLGRRTHLRRLSGHAYMVDVEPGKERLRVKMSDGRDVTLDVAQELSSRIAAALDHVVEVEIQEEREGEVSVSRTALDLSVLASSGRGSDRPPKSVEELEREQGLPKERPDYVALASAVWETSEDLADFERYVRELREAAAR